MYVFIKMVVVSSGVSRFKFRQFLPILKFFRDILSVFLQISGLFNNFELLTNNRFFYYEMRIFSFSDVFICVV